VIGLAIGPVKETTEITEPRVLANVRGRAVRRYRSLNLVHALLPLRESGGPLTPPDTLKGAYGRECAVNLYRIARRLRTGRLNDERNDDDPSALHDILFTGPGPVQDTMSGKSEPETMSSMPHC
jgi:hypothetical protein